MVAFRPINLQDAFTILADNDVYILNGGTDLMVKKKVDPGLIPNFDKDVMFISQLEEIKKICLKDKYIHIGSGCTYSEILKSDLIPDIMKSPIRELASPAIRNLATIGGNVCNASPAGDILPILYAFDARIVVTNKFSEREVPIEDFILAPSKNALVNNEMCTEIKVPKESFNKLYYKKVGTRKATAIAKLSFAGLAKIEEGILQDIRISFGAVGPTVVRPKAIEKAMIGRTLEELASKLEEYKSELEKVINPIDDQRSNAVYRKRVCLNLFTDFINTLKVEKAGT